MSTVRSTNTHYYVGASTVGEYLPYYLAVSKPNVVVTTPGDVLYAGTNLTLICNITLSGAVDNDVIVDADWFNGSANIGASISDRVSLSSLTGTEPSFTSTLLISPLIDVDNRINLRCQARARSDSMFIGPSEIGEDAVNISVMQRS